MLPYFPFKDDSFKITMGVQPLDGGSLIEVDDHYHSELALKNELLTHEYERYCQALTGTLSLQWETLAVVLPDMAKHYPQYFTLTIDGDSWVWQNRLLNSTTHFVFGKDNSFPLTPLDWLGRQVQEDLLILSGTKQDGMPLVAGHLCFPNAWCLDDKMRQSFLDIHQSVPGFAQSIGHSAQLLMERLKVERPVWRVNWSIMATPRLSLPPHIFGKEQVLSQDITPENIGERCFVRIERQTLSRLPNTKGILFTVRTYQEPIAAATSTPSMHIASCESYKAPLATSYTIKGLHHLQTYFLHTLQRRNRQHEPISSF